MVSHNILLWKLDVYGIRGIAHQWFVAYLKNREQLVEIDCIDVMIDDSQQKQSEKKLIQHGVPHFSILRPLLFLTHTY